MEFANDLLDRLPANEKLPTDPRNRVHALHPPPPAPKQGGVASAQLTNRGVKIGRRYPRLGGQFCTPVHTLFFIFRDIGLRDTHLGLILAHTLINLPLATLLLKSFFDDVPRELDESAMLDGATRLDVFRMVVLPLVKGGMAATAVLCFIFSWTEFLISLQMTTSIRTIPVKITTFVTSTGTEWGMITALGSAALLPSFIFIMLVQRHLVRGLTLGSLKE